jgi:hypothetical protein
MFVHNRQHHNHKQSLIRQDSFSGAEFEKYRKKTRKEQFLEEMDSIIPWKELTDVIEPVYPKPQLAAAVCRHRLGP